jgi:DNA-binding IclR family transcriptional regulator
MTSEIRSVTKALKILETLGSHGPQGVAELSRRLEIHKSVVSKLLSTMRARGFVRVPTSTGRFDLGMRLYSLAQLVQERLTFRTAILPRVRELSEETGETAFAAIWENDQVHYPCEYVSRRPIRLGPRVGVMRPPFHDAAQGDGRPPRTRLCHAAAADGELLKEPDLPSQRSWKRELLETRKNGYAVEQELHGHLTAVAAPLPHTGNPVTAASSWRPSLRIEQYGVARLGSLIAERRLSRHRTGLVHSRLTAHPSSVRPCG